MKTSILKTVVLFIFSAISVSAYSSEVSTDPVNTAKVVMSEDVRGEQLLSRLKEIKAIKKSELSREERKALRKEVKAIKKELAADHKGIYLSFGAAIIVLLLLILIL